MVQGDEVAKTRSVNQGINGGVEENVHREQYLAWRVKVRNLLVLACGPDSVHFKAFEEAENRANWSGSFRNFLSAQAVFGAAKEDFDGGYLVSMKYLLQAELFETELEQAKELLAAGYHPAAAVIAGVVLETSLRQLCVELGLPIGKLERMNADLTKAGRYNSLVQKRVTALAAIRNSAAHGDHLAFSKADVVAMVEDVGRLVGEWLSQGRS
ncbi:DUF4145 domain-containing protein [Roseateles sp. DB2]